MMMGRALEALKKKKLELLTIRLLQLYASMQVMEERFVMNDFNIDWLCM